MHEATGQAGSGQAETGRREDVRLLTGRGRFMADMAVPGCLHAVFLRADAASARLTALDCAAARAMPGVRAVLTHADLGGIGPLPLDPLPRDDGGRPAGTAMPLLVDDTIRHPGEPLAMVVADSADAARDAAEAIAVETEDQPPATGIAWARSAGDAAAVAAALAGARHRIETRVDIPRLHAVALEPRCALALLEGGALHLHASTQSPHALRKSLAALLGRDPATVRVIAGDVGGSFGMKGTLMREEALVAVAAQHLGAPVLWVAGRGESFTADPQGRGLIGRVTLGLDAALNFVALEGEFDADSGAYPSARAMGVAGNVGGFAGVYRIPAVSARITGHLSPRAPIASYRGAGRPEMTHAVEAAIDAAARALGADPVELRRRNLIGPDAMPHRTALAFTFDSGDFPAVMARAVHLADVAGAPARRREAARRGRLHGLGLVNCVEVAGGPLAAPRPDRARLTLRADGSVTLSAGLMSVGQGHETALPRLVAARLGIPLARIAYDQGDTDSLPDGRGNGGSSGMAVGGAALHLALERLVAEGREETARAFGADAAAVDFAEGVFALRGTNRSASLAEIAARHGAAGWRVEAVFQPDRVTFPNGTHVCEVEIDPDTGDVALTRYTAVEDIGRVHNPDLVAGQMHGGITQGIAQALGERMVFDDAHQVLTGSFMDYRMLRADETPAFTLATHEVPTAVNPLGAKGVGEAGTVGGLAAAMSAIGDALHRAGVAEFQMPATPCRVWQALAAARQKTGAQA